MSKPIMIFHITIEKEKVTKMEGPLGKVAIIPFGGYVNADVFKGTIVPGASDVQVTNAAGIRHMCAKYMFEGKDAEGRKCYLYGARDIPYTSNDKLDKGKTR